ncbi:MAG: chromosomal replication initiator protein DnaA [Alphaproteobacteria bacterium]|nr:chromosomal replication initiator protein DnaA [Alphaproteobacteria bacterium]MBQ3117095.1 chromosomal replication initiator protein DnaA [Alphaproteobacteria bacterium]MBQ6855309.1 chromosomal replication initiator protein DnaA [Alphaproteobacteria bacterium]MBQ8557796.1 chromosomal replication initiator protein DnaA [Alphaproteobacteria bacterium]
MEQNDLIHEWQTVYGNLEKEVNNQMVLRWLKRSVPERKEGNQVCLCFPTPCIEEMIKRNYSDQILAVWQRENPQIDTLKFRVKATTAKSVSDVCSIPTTSTPIITTQSQKYITHTPSKIEIEVSSDGESIPSYLDATHTFDSFVVGKSNQFAYEASRRVAEDTGISFNPLYIQAPVGLGKTHLMHAIAWRIKEIYPDKNVLYLSSEQFFQHFIKSLRKNNTDSFRDLFRSVDVLMIDDVQFIFGKKATQEEFFHTFNQLIARGKKIILSADTNPMDLESVEERLKTRIAQGLVVQIQPTTYELRLGILQEKMKTVKTQIPNDVLDFLAKNITASVRELEGALKRLIAQAEMLGTAINLETTRQVLRDILQVYERQFSVAEIQQTTAAYYNLKLSDLKSTRRDRKIARPRQLAMYLAKTMTALSLPDIGAQFGRDHTTIIHAVKTIEGLLERDAQLNTDKENILIRLREGMI